jgi:hypothetical protein
VPFQIGLIKIDNTQDVKNKATSTTGLPSAHRLDRLLLKIYFFVIIEGVSLAMSADCNPPIFSAVLIVLHAQMHPTSTYLKIFYTVEPFGRPILMHELHFLKGFCAETDLWTILGSTVPISLCILNCSDICEKSPSFVWAI